MDRTRAAELHQKAAKLDRKACDGGDSAACNSLALMHSMGWGVAQDDARAVALYQKACDSADAYACDRLGDAYSKGRGVARDRARAAALYEKACTGAQVGACYKLADALEDGRGVARDQARALELYQKACDSLSRREEVIPFGSVWVDASAAGAAEACLALGHYYRGKDEVRAAEMYQKACDGRLGFACGCLGDMYRRGVGVTKDEPRAGQLDRQAADFDRRGCDGGDGGACFTLALMEEDTSRIAQQVQKACDLEWPGACEFLGHVYFSGEWVPKDRARAAEARQKACDLGVPEACYHLGVQYSSGDGVGRDDTRAAGLYREACELGSTRACRVLGGGTPSGGGASTRPPGPTRAAPGPALQPTRQPTPRPTPAPTPKPSSQPALVLWPKGSHAGEIRANTVDGLEYVWIPAGTFQMGCVDGDSECQWNERPRHVVTLSRGFWMGRTEVTDAAYQRFPSATRKRARYGTLPAVKVTWHDAQAFCQWCGGRLPTEAEWEYAARGGRIGLRYPWGNSITRESASFLGTGLRPVASYPANGFGVHDMAGNAAEWCADWFDSYYDAQDGAAVLDPAGPSSGEERVLRGGSSSEFADTLRASDRFSAHPEEQRDSVGFRCVMDANP